MNPSAIPRGKFIDAKKACEMVISTLSEVGTENYRFGHTKLFFKAGMIGLLEDLRDERISSILTKVKLSLDHPTEHSPVSYIDVGDNLLVT